MARPRNVRQGHRISEKGCCPSCGSLNIRERTSRSAKAHGIVLGWRCQTCAANFDSPDMGVKSLQTHQDCAGDAQTGSVAHIAPLTYRQQLMREILAANAAARQSVEKSAQGRYYGLQSKRRPG